MLDVSIPSTLYQRVERTSPWLGSALDRLGDEEVDRDGERDGGAAQEDGDEVERVFVPARARRLSHLCQSPDGRRGGLLPPLVFLSRGHQRLRGEYFRCLKCAVRGTNGNGKPFWSFTCKQLLKRNTRGTSDVNLLTYLG